MIIVVALNEGISNLAWFVMTSRIMSIESLKMI